LTFENLLDMVLFASIMRAHSSTNWTAWYSSFPAMVLITGYKSFLGQSKNPMAVGKEA